MKTEDEVMLSVHVQVLNFNVNAHIQTAFLDKSEKSV
jgi:hypothetical protein